MSGNDKILEQMKFEPANVRFGDLRKICEVYFGKPRGSGGSHLVFKGDRNSKNTVNRNSTSTPSPR